MVQVWIVKSLEGSLTSKIKWKELKGYIMIETYSIGKKGRPKAATDQQHTGTFDLISVDTNLLNPYINPTTETNSFSSHSYSHSYSPRKQSGLSDT